VPGPSSPINLRRISSQCLPTTRCPASASRLGWLSPSVADRLERDAATTMDALLGVSPNQSPGREAEREMAAVLVVPTGFESVSPP
jgi:hypothetical protein